MVEMGELEKMSQEKLTDEDLKAIVEKIEEKGEEESKFFLKLSLFENRCHPEGKYKESYKVLFGEVREIEVHKINGDCSTYTDIIIIPETKVVMILYYDGFGEPDTVYVFTISKGWVKISL